MPAMPCRVGTTSDCLMRSLLALLLLGITGARGADVEVTTRQQPPRGAYMASQCKEASQCPKFDEVYAATPAFRHALSLSLRHGDEVVPEWVKVKLPKQGERNQIARDTPSPGTASSMLPLRIDDRSYLLGRMADPERPEHIMAVLYDTTRGFATVHYVNREGKTALLGDGTDILRRVMTDFLNADSPFAKSLGRPDVALPVPVRSQ